MSAKIFCHSIISPCCNRIAKVAGLNGELVYVKLKQSDCFTAGGGETKCPHLPVTWEAGFVRGVEGKIQMSPLSITQLIWVKQRGLSLLPTKVESEVSKIMFE